MGGHRAAVLGGALTVGYVRLYPGEAWKSRPGWGGRPGLVLPWGLEERDGPVVVCGDPADTARALELGGRAVGLAEPTAPLDELAAFLAGDLATAATSSWPPGRTTGPTRPPTNWPDSPAGPSKSCSCPRGHGACATASEHHTPEREKENSMVMVNGSIAAPPGPRPCSETPTANPSRPARGSP